MLPLAGAACRCRSSRWSCWGSRARRPACSSRAAGRRRQRSRRSARSCGRCARPAAARTRRCCRPPTRSTASRSRWSSSRAAAGRGDRRWSASPAVALIVACGLVVVGTVVLIASPASRAWRPDAGDHGATCSARSPRRACARSWPRRRPPASPFGAMEVTLPRSPPTTARGPPPARCSRVLGDRAAASADWPTAVASTRRRAGGALGAPRASSCRCARAPLLLAPLDRGHGAAGAGRRACALPSWPRRNQLVDVAPAGTITEAFTWPHHGDRASGVAAGNAAAGAIVQASLAPRRGVVVRGQLRGAVALAGRWTRRARREAGAAAAAGCRSASALRAPVASARRPSPTASRWSTPQKASAIRCSPRWRTSRTRRSPSGAAAVRAAPEAVVGVAGLRGCVPGSQCAPWMTHGTTCSSRQNTARRSPSGSAARKPSSVADVDPAPAAVLAVIRAAEPSQRRRPSAIVASHGRAPTIIVLEGDQTGQELLEQAAARARPRRHRDRPRARALRPLARAPARDRQRGRRRGRARDARGRASASRRRRSRPRARTTSARPTGSCARRSTARSSSAPAAGSPA